MQNPLTILEMAHFPKVLVQVGLQIVKFFVVTYIV